MNSFFFFLIHRFCIIFQLCDPYFADEETEAEKRQIYLIYFTQSYRIYLGINIASVLLTSLSPQGRTRMYLLL